MALIDWEDIYSVNVGEIDEEHKKLVGMINDLHQAMKDKKTKEVLDDIISGLIEYSGSHFAHEEKYFEEFNYLDATIHRKEHRDFVVKVKKFKQDFDDGIVLLSLDIMNFLKDWLLKHIQGSDKKYSTLFNEKGLS